MADNIDKTTETQSADNNSNADKANEIKKPKSKSKIQTYDDVPRYVKNFLIYIETIKGLSPRTVTAYYYDIRLFLRYLIYRNGCDCELDEIDVRDFPLKDLDKVTLTDIYEYMAYIHRDRDNAAAARARKATGLRTFYGYLTDKNNLIKNNPTVNLDSPKIGKRQPIYLDLESSKKLLTSAVGENPRDYCILTLLLNCGMRVSELVGINISDIKSDTLTVVGKGNKERTIYLNESCISAINKYLEVRPHEGVKDRDALFLNANLYRLGVRGVQLIVKKYLGLAGLDTKKITTHKLRHTAATLMYKYGNVDVLELQEILGHVSVATTQIYTHTDNERLKKAVENNPLADFDDDKK